jgi:hypothetical protein
MESRAHPGFRFFSIKNTGQQQVLLAICPEMPFAASHTHAGCFGMERYRFCRAFVSANQIGINARRIPMVGTGR